MRVYREHFGGSTGVSKSWVPLRVSSRKDCLCGVLKGMGPNEEGWCVRGIKKDLNLEQNLLFKDYAVGLGHFLPVASLAKSYRT